MAENQAKVEVTLDTRQLTQGLGQVKGKLDAFTGAIGKFGLGFVAGGGLQVAVQAFNAYTEAVSQAIDKQVELNTALKNMDSGGLVGRMAAVNKQLDRMAELSTAAEKGGLRGIAAQVLLARQGFSELFLGEMTPEEERRQLEAGARAKVGAEEAVKQNKLAVASIRDRLQAERQLQQAARREGDLGDVQAAARRMDELGAQEAVLERRMLAARQEEERAKYRLTVGGAIPAETEKRFLMEQAGLNDDLARKEQARRLATEQAEKALKAEIIELQTLRARAVSEREVRAAQAEGSEARRATDRKTTALRTAESIEEAERGLARSLAEVRGDVLDDTRRVTEERRASALATAAAEIQGIEQTTAATMRGIAERRAQAQRELGGLGALAGLIPAPELERRRIALTSNVEKLTEELDEAAKEGANQRAKTEEQSAARLKQIAIQSAQDRLAILERTLQRDMQMRMTMTSTLTTLGLRTSAQNIQEQFGLAKAARPGSPQQAAAFQAAAQGLAAQQGASRGAAGGILGAVSERLGGYGSMSDVQQAFADIQKESRETIGDFRSGGAVDLAALQQGMGMLPLFEQTKQLGGVGAVFGQAATPLAEQFSAMAGPGGQSAFDALVKGADQPLGDLVANFNATFDQLDKRVTESVDRWIATIDGKMPEMAATIERELVRSLDLARGKR